VHGSVICRQSKIRVGHWQSAACILISCDSSRYQGTLKRHKSAVQDSTLCQDMTLPCTTRKRRVLTHHTEASCPDTSHGSVVSRHSVRGRHSNDDTAVIVAATKVHGTRKRHMSAVQDSPLCQDTTLPCTTLAVLSVINSLSQPRGADQAAYAHTVEAPAPSLSRLLLGGGV
jgi:hypothetical protein